MSNWCVKITSFFSLIVVVDVVDVHCCSIVFSEEMRGEVGWGGIFLRLPHTEEGDGALIHIKMSSETLQGTLDRFLIEYLMFVCHQFFLRFLTVHTAGIKNDSEL